MVAQKEVDVALLSSDHVPQEEQLVGVDNAKAITTAHDGVGSELMHISQSWTRDAY